MIVISPEEINKGKTITVIDFTNKSDNIGLDPKSKRFYELKNKYRTWDLWLEQSVPLQIGPSIHVATIVEFLDFKSSDSDFCRHTKIY